MGLQATLYQFSQEELEEILENPTVFFDINPNDGNHRHVDIDKSWDGIRFLLSNGNYGKTGNKMTRLSSVILSEQIIEELEKYDIAATHYLTSDQVKQVLKELDNITEQTLRDNFRPEVMNKEKVYGWPYDNSAFDWLFENFIKVKSFYFDAGQQNKAVIISIL